MILILLKSAMTLIACSSIQSNCDNILKYLRCRSLETAGLDASKLFDFTYSAMALHWLPLRAVSKSSTGSDSSDSPEIHLILLKLPEVFFLFV